MNPIPNPITTLAMLNTQQWLFFLVNPFSQFAYNVDDDRSLSPVGLGMPLISSRTNVGPTCPLKLIRRVSLTTTQLSEYFNRPISDISWGITAVLMLRSAGSIIFGIASDRWGRKWPFIVNMVLFIVLELGAGFSQTWPQFLACRALFGVGECY